MSHHDVIVESPVQDSFRVSQIVGMFDVPLTDRSGESFSVELPESNGNWRIGLIVGASGSGKSTVARHAYGDAMVQGYDWSHDAAVIDGFGDEVSGKDIAAMFNAVGFSSPPAWVRPYHVLSGGQRFRCDLARALMLDSPLVVFDEFTSVVDRIVAKIGSECVSKAIRRDHAKCRRFVAVTCHYDVTDWLSPDWILDMADCTLRWPRGELRRPPIAVEIRRCERSLWRMFARHHYLNHGIHNAARCYVAVYEGEPIAFCSTLMNCGFKGRRRVNRLVTLPDYQGIGVGPRLLDAVCEHESASGYVMSIVTSHPKLTRSLLKSKRWRLGLVSRSGKSHTRSGITGMKTGSVGRSTVSFRFIDELKNNARHRSVGVDEASGDLVAPIGVNVGEGDRFDGENDRLGKWATMPDGERHTLADGNTKAVIADCVGFVPVQDRLDVATLEPDSFHCAIIRRDRIGVGSLPTPALSQATIPQEAEA